MTSDLAAAARNLNARKQQAAADYLIHRRPNRYFRAVRRAADAAVRALWPHFFPDAGFCLLAAGGYGRGEVYPHSDTDLVLVCAEPPSHTRQEQTAAMVQAMWDAGLAPALKTGTADELIAGAAQDLTADTAFLEARFLCGDADLAAHFMQAADAERDPAAFAAGKLLEMRLRHDKQQGAGALLEPNVKTCPGGLRDIHTMLWLAKAQGLPGGIRALMAQHILTRAEALLLARSHRTLAAIRIGLHLAAGREEDRLVFDLQSRLAADMGFADETGRLKSERLMELFYRAAKAVKQLGGIIPPALQSRTAPPPQAARSLDGDYCQSGTLLCARDPLLFQKQPQHIFKMAEILQRNNGLTAPDPATLRAWWAAARGIGSRFYADEANRRRFIGFFRHGSGLARTMRFLNLYGVLGRYLPAWERITGLLQHDLFHIYPVDEHILTVLRNMRRLAMEQHVHELPFASALMHAFPRPYILYLAAFFHDIAKGRGGDHAVQGIADARSFAADHFMPAEDAELLCWLVEDHLLMSLTAQKEDIQDPAVIERFCRRVRTPERLSALYLLTVADIRGTNPKLWNSWKDSLLQTLFQTASRRLAGQSDSRAAVTGRRQSAAEQALAAAGYSEKQRRSLWQALGPAYFVRHRQSEILWHTAFLAGQSDKAQAHIRPHPVDPSVLQIAAYLPNASGIFVGLCRILARHSLDIAAARAFVTEHDYVLDTFAARLPEGSTGADRRRIEAALMHDLEQFLHGAPPPPPGRTRIPSRRARSLPIAPVIAVRAEEDRPGWHTLTLIAVNRTGLLADTAEVLNRHGAALRYAKINTSDERAEDSFLLYAPALSDPNRQLALQKDLEAVSAV
ncbi:PII uridylyl-transferase [Kingella potus]|uniref:Bifunctional uridylyltransferase/uridylyl-removing enzyme n=1 Tax=Kingella potus TaxID=265175 RepID=A0A377R0F1_9NEIS|nr:[protein-PII] uridylyltransferase [Kingella potus]STR00747.1 PII uridylyl-transferase [Kingella potus]